jgi:hypothetical protein
MDLKKKNPDKIISKDKTVNWTVVILSIIALICLPLVYYVSYLFLIPIAVIIFINQRELMKKKTK